MKKSQIIGALLAVFVSVPIWFYLLYKILEAVNATELMWFMYWIYLPATTLSLVIAKLSGDE